MNEIDELKKIYNVEEQDDGFVVTYNDIKINHLNKTYCFQPISIYFYYDGSIMVISGSHPHISGTNICLGKYHGRISSAIKNGNYLYATIMVKSILSNYGRTPFFNIRNFDQEAKKCDMCLTITTSYSKKKRKIVCSICEQLYTKNPFLYEKCSKCLGMFKKTEIVCVNRKLVTKAFCKGCLDEKKVVI